MKGAQIRAAQKPRGPVTRGLFPSGGFPQPFQAPESVALQVGGILWVDGTSRKFRQALSCSFTEYGKSKAS